VILLLAFVLIACGVLALVNRLPDDDYFKYWVDCIPHRAPNASPDEPETTGEVAA
jgi:hypothetical protein